MASAFDTTMDSQLTSGAPTNKATFNSEFGILKAELNHGGFVTNPVTSVESTTEAALAAVHAASVGSATLPWYVAEEHGVVFDGFEAGFSSNLTSGSPIVTRASGGYDWSASDVGKVIWFVLNDGSRFKSTILSVQSVSQVTLANNAPVTETGRPTRFGTDCTTALNALCATVRNAGPHFGVIQLPPGLGVITGRILTGHGVMLRGAGGIFATQIYAAPGTYTDDCMFRLDDPSNLNEYHHQQIIEGMRINADANVGKCIFVNNINENGGLFDLDLAGYTLKAFHCTGTSLNFSIRRTNCGTFFGGASTVGLHISGTDRISIAEGTFNGGGDDLGVGILVDGATSSVTIVSTHHEGSQDGIRIDNGKVTCIGIHGHGSVANLVHANGGQVIAMGLFPHWTGEIGFKETGFWGVSVQGGGTGIYASRWEGFTVTAPHDHVATGQARFHMGDAQQVASLAVRAATNTTGPFAEFESWGGQKLVFGTDRSITGAMSPWVDATGDQSAALSAQSRKLTGNVTGIPIANGWWARYMASGAARTITPAGGNCILPDGTSQATATIAAGTRAVVHGDGANLIVDGGSVT